MSQGRPGDIIGFSTQSIYIKRILFGNIGYMNKLELGGALIGVMVVVFTLGVYASDKISNSSQPAQVLRFDSLLKSSASKTKAPVTTLTPKTFQMTSPTTPSMVPTTPTTPSTPGVSSLWKRFKDTTGQPYTEVPQSSIQTILRFCEEFKTASNNGNGVAKLAWQNPNDGKYYCMNSNGSVSSTTCGNGSQSSCIASGCCGSCLGGVLPPGVTDLTQLPGLFFVPNRIIEAIENRVR